MIAKFEQEAHPKAEQGETPLCLIQKRCRYSSLALNTPLTLDYKCYNTNGKVRATQQLVGALVCTKMAYEQSAVNSAIGGALKIGVWANCGQISNWWALFFTKINVWVTYGTPSKCCRKNWRASSVAYPDGLSNKCLGRGTLRSQVLEHLVGSGSPLSLT